MGTERTSIFLYGGTMGLNPMIKPHHQLDSELMAISLGQKKAQKTLETLMAFNIFPTLRLISDSQTLLTLCFKPAVTLAMGTGLLVHRVQDLFTNAGLYFAPGHLFNGNVDLLTRYDQLLASKITKECYSPAFLRLRLEDRATTPVALMNKIVDSDLPQKNPKTMKYAMLPGGQKGNIFVSSSQSPNVTELPSAGFQSTGKGALNSNVRCQQPCGTCGMASPALYYT